MTKHASFQRVWSKVTFVSGIFHECIMPEQIESLWGPIPLGRLPPGEDNVCKVVTHNVVANGQKKFTAYLIHCLPLKMSAIQLFVGDKMAVVAHLVGQETIGYENQLRLDQEFQGRCHLRFFSTFYIKPYNTRNNFFKSL